MADVPLTLNALLILFSFSAILWAMFTVYSKLNSELREQRILLNILCKHNGINPDDFLGGKQ